MKISTVIIGLALIFASPAMAIDFNVTIKNIDGTDATGADGKPAELKLSKVCIDALLNVFPDEQNLVGVDKIKRYMLAQNIQEHRDYSMTSEETELVKKLVAKLYGPLIVGQAWALLDPVSVPKKEK